MRTTLTLLTLPLCSLSALAQAPESGNPAQTYATPDLPALMETWRAAHGPSWRLVESKDTGHLELLHGGSLAADALPSTDGDFADLARLFLGQTEELHGIDAATLVEKKVTWLPMAGTNDKYTVRLDQEVNAVPVVDGRVNVLMNLDGDLLSVHSTALPDLAGFPTTPTLAVDAAARRALDSFTELTDLRATTLGAGQLVILPVDTAELQTAALGWRFDVLWEEDDTMPVGRTLFISAHDGDLLAERQLVHTFDVGGTVSTMATPGTYPDSGSNQETSHPMAYARVTSSAGTTYTDVNGDFNYPGVNSALSVSLTYNGTFNDVNNSAGGEYSLTTTAQPGQSNAITMNPSGSTLVTAQANAFVSINRVRDYVRGVTPSDSTADFVALANVNISSTCNAYFDGNSTNYYQAGGGCANTAFSTVVAHEVGHWLNVDYGTGNGSDGMGEGNADVFGTYIYDDPIVGQDFCGTGCNVRSGNNTRQYCGDCCGGCYGQVHADGEVWMGAAWKVRRNLNTTHGNTTGDAISDTLFMGWMNAYNQSAIHSIIETQWLTLDDDDGNIDNGSPNYSDINDGFMEQGFPGFDLALISIGGVTALPDTEDEYGPYVVDATIIPLVSPPLTSASVFYSVAGGGFIELPMTATGGDGFQASIPGQVSPTTVDYYVSASDSGGNTETFPDGAPSSTLGFSIGNLQIFFADDFESSGDNGWTHASYGDTSNSQDDWQHGSPNGMSGSGWSDPSSATSGTSVWGNDLGPSGWNGEYQGSVHSYLRSPSIDCSQGSGVELRFQRWLTVERGSNDDARILVNGNEAWSNPNNSDLRDLAWSQQVVDISTWADGNSSVTIEFELQTSSGTNRGGWTIDDLEVMVLGPSTGACPTPANYGTAKTTSMGWTPHIFHTGSPRVATGDLTVSLMFGDPSQAAILASSSGQANTPFFGGTLYLAAPITRGQVIFLGSFGDADVSIPVDASMVGTTRFYQYWFRDPADAQGVGLSEGLQVTFCD
ncbi:MAG TPA: hypothetical protein QF730_03440 [Planctomycetota bacterium]|nr:hypothetical protein [Planctomycetota bacterium]